MNAARQPGERVTESVQLERLIGNGAMGDVWLARHATLGSEVVVKLLRQTDAGPDEHARFEQEARAIARMGSPYVVQVFDLGRTADDQPFIVMELLRGEDLKCRLEHGGALSLDDTVTLVTQLCRALGRAHELGVVHRDIKPANLFLVDAGGGLHVKVLDFGVAKILHGDLDMTATGALLGTPYYMSPEQLIAPRLVDHRADLWATAVVAYACLVGSLPFLGDTLGALSVAVHSGEFAAPSSLRAHLPHALDAWMKRAFHPRLEERFTTASEVAETFAEAARAEHVPAEEIEAQQTSAPAPAFETVLTAATPSKRQPRRGVPGWAAALVGGAALAAVGITVAPRFGTTPPAPSTAAPSIEPAALTPGEQKVCPNCGAANGPKNRYCRACGVELAEHQDHDEPKNPPSIIDFARFVPKVEAAALAKRSDAVLDSVTVIPVPEDGRLLEGEVKLVFIFHSKKADSCLVLYGATMELKYEERGCDGRPAAVPLPRCTPAAVRKRMGSKLPSGEVTLYYRADAHGKGEWEANTKPPTRLLDDCPFE
jgi:eukaryotic-like serine/threonine-protein kinase